LLLGSIHEYSLGEGEMNPRRCVLVALSLGLLAFILTACGPHFLPLAFKGQSELCFAANGGWGSGVRIYQLGGEQLPILIDQAWKGQGRTVYYLKDGELGEVVVPPDVFVLYLEYERVQPLFFTGNDQPAQYRPRYSTLVDIERKPPKVPAWVAYVSIIGVILILGAGLLTLGGN